MVQASDPEKGGDFQQSEGWLGAGESTALSRQMGQLARACGHDQKDGPSSMHEARKELHDEQD
jgi:hypothetical protein